MAIFFQLFFLPVIFLQSQPMSLLYLGFTVIVLSLTSCVVYQSIKNNLTHAFMWFNFTCYFSGFFCVSFSSTQAF